MIRFLLPLHRPLLPPPLRALFAISLYDRMGVFRLTQPGGMKLIQECKLKGFHMHPDDVVIYEDADAHLDWVQGKHMSVADLR